MSVDVETLALWREVATASTPGLVKGLFRSDDPDEQVAQFKETLLLSPPGKCWAVCCAVDAATPIEDEALYAAITGNGPTSEANARFFAGARAAFLMAIDEIERLKGCMAAMALRDMAMSTALLKACDHAQSLMTGANNIKEIARDVAKIRKLGEP